MSLTQAPEAFLSYNDAQTKQLVVVVDIEGLDLLTSRLMYQRLRYGDPFNYGDSGLVYDGMRPVGMPGERGQQACLSLDGSSLTITQRLEPEQGRASISTLSMTFTDLNGYMTQAISPGLIIPDILGANVRVWLGYIENSFPEEYYPVWRGVVTQATPDNGRVVLQFSDPNVKRRQNVFYSAKTKLTGVTGTVAAQVTASQFYVSTALAARLAVDLKIVVSNGTKTEIATITALGDLQTPEPNGIKVTVNAPFSFTPSAGHSIIQQGINKTDTAIAVISNSDFTKKIVGPSGAYDSDVKLYLKIDDEFLEYQQAGSEASGFGANQFVGVTRGARGSIKDAHDLDADVEAWAEVSGHAIDMTLKLMLSGWAGPYKTDVEIFSFARTTDPDVGDLASGIVLPVGVDAVRDYGLQAGDYLTVTGSPTPANNGACRVMGFANIFGRPNEVILTDKTFSVEVPTTAKLAMRSQYDTYPTTFGSRLSPADVDVAGHVYFKNTFLGAADNSLRFLIGEQTTAKEFIEKEIMLPLSAYTITRQGKLSMGLTKPPIADQRTTTLSLSNIIDPLAIRPTRGLNNRKFFNEIQWRWDADDSGTFRSALRRLDSSSLSKIGVSSVLPIESKGTRTDLGFENVVERRNRFLLARYGQGAVLIPVKTNFGTGNQIEAGDVVILKDNGELQIANMSTGARDMGVSLMEVIDRALDIRSGQVSLTLQTGIGASLEDRFATVAPSSRVTAGSSAARVQITESFGEIFPAREFDKWTDYVGLRVRVHSQDYTRDEETTFIGFAADNARAILLDPPLSFTPQAGDIVDLADYPDTEDANDQKVAKLVHCYLTKQISVLAGINQTQFTANIADAQRLVGSTIVVHSDDWTQLSDEVAVAEVSGTTVTVSAPLGFTPTAGMKVDLVSFKDGGGPYRWI